MAKLAKPIEHFFFESLLKIGFLGILIVTTIDLIYTQFIFTRPVIIDFAILFALITSLFIYWRGYFFAAHLWVAFLILATMFYAMIAADSLSTPSMAVVMVVGLSFSVQLKGRTALPLHVVTIVGIFVVHLWLAMHHDRYQKPNANEIIILGISYTIIYSLIAAISWILKQRYDEALQILEVKNLELSEKSNEIETQNEELQQSQENLSELNSHLESLVEKRTLEVQKQNEQLISYAYSNAHHMRGPVARVLGLIQLSQIETNLDYPFLFEKIKEQTIEIDKVVKQINRELEQ
jgi:signal transduction histidine kinase